MSTLGSMSSGPTLGFNPSRLYSLLIGSGCSHDEAKQCVDSLIRQRTSQFSPINALSALTATITAQGQPMPSVTHTQYQNEDFEEGDEVESLDGKSITLVKLVPGMPDYDKRGYVDPQTGFVDMDDMWQFKDQYVMKKKKKQKVTKLAFDETKLDALVIDEKAKEEILAVLKQHKNHDKLFEEWGLGDIIEYGRGMTFMFYGGPGTGKTYGANCIAKALGTELLTLSAAEIQSSEPGGANRAIQDAFKEAKKSGKVIFLDECDSLIASRNDLGMVLASEVNTLLTEIEKFEGVAILATNRIEHMDEALERRISLIVEFPNPDYPNRKKIWGKLLPKKMPIGKDISIDTLAKEELTGGQIKNVVLQAARMALAGECKSVEQKHFDLAIARIKKSKNLMGSASRYHQGLVRDDFGVSSGVKSKVRKFRDFLTDDLDEDIDITTDKKPKKDE